MRMRNFQFKLRTLLFGFALTGLLAAVFHCQIASFSDSVFGTNVGSQLRVIDSESSLRNAMDDEHCIIFLCHDWATDDVFLRQKLESEFQCRKLLGKFRIYILQPTDPAADKGESDRMHALMKRMCDDDDLPRFHWFHNPSGMFFWKIGDKVEWKLGIRSIEELTTQTGSMPSNAG